MADKELGAGTITIATAVDSDTRALVRVGANSREIKITNNFLTGDDAPETAWTAAKKARARKTIAQAKVAFSSSDTLVENHRGAFVSLAGSTGTLALTAVATLGDGFECVVSNDASGDWTLDPNSSEQIDGAATATMKPGDRWVLFCDGSALRTLRNRNTNGATARAQIGATSVGDALITAADAAAARSAIYAAPLDALAFNGLQINGGVDVSQELGTTGATLANNTAKYTADMWEAHYNHGAATAVVTSGQIAAASFPAALPGYSFAQRIRATTIIGSPASGDFARHRQRIEGYRTARLAWGTASAQPITLAFQFYAMRTGTQMLRVSNAAGNRFYHTDFAVVAGWNFVTKTILGDTSGIWVTNDGTGMIVDVFGLGKESSPATADAWGATGKVATTGSDGSNQYSSTNDNTLATALLVLPGIELPPQDRLPFIMRPFDEEVLRCQRYWEKSYEYGVAPGTASIAGNGILIATNTLAGSTNGNVGGPNTIAFKATKRATPTFVAYDFDGTANAVRVYPTDAKKTGVSAYVGVKSVGTLQFFSFTSTNATAVAAGNQLAFSWTAAAPL
jgi:hypothetical protein